MKLIRSTCLAMAAAVLAGLMIPAIAGAQDPAVVNAKTVKIKLENPQVRVLEAELKPGEMEKQHSHPAYVIYVITGGKLRNHYPDGRTVEFDLAPGATVYTEPVTHWAENIGTTTVHLILVELKERARVEAGSASGN